MKALLLIAMLVLAPAASADDKDDVRGLRKASPDFYKGVITGLTNGYIGSYLVICPDTVSGGMVLAVLDTTDRQYDSLKPVVAVLHVLQRLGCDVDTEYMIRRLKQKESEQK